MNGSSVRVAPDVASDADSRTARHAVDTTSEATRLQPSWISLLAVFAVALALRLYAVRTAYNIFVDEVSYTVIARNLAGGDGLTLFGQPFTLHPPVAFILLGAGEKAFGIGSEPLDQQVLFLRIIPAIFGAAGVVLGYLVAARLTSTRRVALVVAGLLAINPFQIYFDSRVLLESFAQFFVAASALLLLLAIKGRTGVRPQVHLLGAAVCAGLGFATKETFGLVWSLALLVLLTLPHVVPRRVTAQVLGGGAAVYGAITAVVWSVYGPRTWWDSHSSGFHRLVGTHQTTGFNAATTKVSLLERVYANLGEYVITYVLLAAGTVAAVAILARSRAWSRRPRTVAETGSIIIAVWTAAAALYLGYATFFGSIEEQMYYIPLLPCTVSLVAFIDHRRATMSVIARRAVALALAAALIASTVVWVTTRRVDHDRYAEFFSWARVNLRYGVTVSVTDAPAQFLLSRVVIGVWPSPEEWRAHRADYVLVDSELVEQGYSPMSLTTLRELEAHSPIAFQTTSDGSTLYLFEVSSAGT